MRNTESRRLFGRRVIYTEATDINEGNIINVLRKALLTHQQNQAEMINWIVRVKNKNFWLAAIPALLLLVQTVAALFGFTLDLGEIGDKLLAVVNAVFALLVILGVVNDPTTAGIADSKQARTYSSPKED